MKKKEVSTVKQVMLHLAENGPANRWELKEKLKKSYGNIYSTITNLKEKKLIRLAKTDYTARNPKIEVEDYQISDSGILVLIYELDVTELNYHIDKIAENLKDWSLIFKKWSLFREAGAAIRETMLYYLKKTVDAGLDAIGEKLFLRNEKLAKRDFPHMVSKLEYSLKTEIERSLLIAPIINKSTDFARLYKQDEDLKRYITLGIKSNITSLLVSLAMWKDVKDWWEQGKSIAYMEEEKASSKVSKKEGEKA